MERQISVGKEYFESRFAQFPRVAYNVDSFGHAATLPGLMLSAGQDRYVMMRPQVKEMTVPASLFRWRGYEDGPDVVTYRIVNEYTFGSADTGARIKQVAADIPADIDHGMLFVGVGDHGGGPTESLIAWLNDHWNNYDDVKLEFPRHPASSTPSGRSGQACLS